VENIQQLIESSKFELGDFKIDAAQKFTADAQIVFVLLLSLARQRQHAMYPDGVRTAEVDLDNALATALSAVEMRVTSGSSPAMLHLEGLMNALERYAAMNAKAPGETAAERLALYRAIVSAIMRLSLEPLNEGQKQHELGVLAA